jgi:hypothetical protein
MVNLSIENSYKLNVYCSGCNVSLFTIWMGSCFHLFMAIYGIGFIILLFSCMGLSSFACRIMYCLDYGYLGSCAFGYSFCMVIGVLARMICNVSIESFLKSSY